MRRPLWILVLAAVVLVGAYFGAARRTSGPPLDPRSTAPDGTKGLVTLVSELGTPIEVVDGVPAATVRRALLLQDRLPRDQADALSAWVEDGGTLVVADPSSLLTPPVGGGVAGAVTDACELSGGAAVLDVGLARRYHVPPAAASCFGDGDQAFLVVQRIGAGTVVSLGGPDLFTNDLLDEADNAVLAAELLVGDGPAVFVRPGLPGGGERTLVDLVDTPVRAALLQLLVAFGVVVAWRARRLGHPVDEPQPVAIEGSELTRAVGRLLAANRRPDRAAAILRDHARRDLSGPLGLALDAPADQVVRTLSGRTTLTADEARRAVADPVRSDDDLVAVAHLLARVREETIHDQPTTVRA